MHVVLAITTNIFGRLRRHDIEVARAVPSTVLEEPEAGLLEQEAVPEIPAHQLQIHSGLCMCPQILSRILRHCICATIVKDLL